MSGSRFHKLIWYNNPCHYFTIHFVINFFARANALLFNPSAALYASEELSVYKVKLPLHTETPTALDTSLEYLIILHELLSVYSSSSFVSVVR